MANVIGLAQILKQNELTLNEKAQTENLLFQSILKLDEIVRELNHFLQNRLKINEKKENVVFSELLHDVLISFLLIMKYENILILPDFSKARELFTIKGYLYNIFFNLISNSIKYRRPDKQLIIEIRSWIENDKIKISIKDNGLVVDLNNKGNGIFGLYKNQSDIEAKGIDLFLVNNQVGLLGGNIDIQSEPDAGNDFLIILPYNLSDQHKSNLNNNSKR